MTPPSSSTRSITPSVSAVSVNEWPEPATRIFRPAAAAAATASASSSRLRGRVNFAGRQR